MPSGEEDAWRVGIRVPEALPVVPVAAPVRFADVVVEDDHEAGSGQRRYHPVQDLSTQWRMYKLLLEHPIQKELPCLHSSLTVKAPASTHYKHFHIHQRRRQRTRSLTCSADELTSSGLDATNVRLVICVRQGGGGGGTAIVWALPAASDGHKRDGGGHPSCCMHTCQRWEGRDAMHRHQKRMVQLADDGIQEAGALMQSAGSLLGWTRRAPWRR